jgi:hypothetical protein
MNFIIACSFAWADASTKVLGARDEVRQQLDGSSTCGEPPGRAWMTRVDRGAAWPRDACMYFEELR